MKPTPSRAGADPPHVAGRRPVARAGDGVAGGGQATGGLGADVSPLAGVVGRDEADDVKRVKELGDGERAA
jgi:hypothetical protein